MQELIDKLKTEVGLTDEQAKQAIETIKNFVVICLVAVNKLKRIAGFYFVHIT